MIYTSKLNEAGQKYLTLTRHVYSALVFVANKSFMNNLPAADRKIIMDAARTASLKGRAYIRDNEAKQLAELKTAGMEIEVHRDIEAFRKATAPVLDATTGDTRKIVENIRLLMR